MRRTLLGIGLAALLAAAALPALATTPVHIQSSHYGGTGFEEAYDVAYDGDGNMLLLGRTFSPSIDLGGGPLPQVAVYDFFLAKYDPSGAHLWSKRYSMNGFYPADFLAVDAAGNVYVTGFVFTTTNLGGGNLVPVGSADLVIAKFDKNGAHQWSQIHGDATEDAATGIAVTPGGTIYLAGYFKGNLDLGGGNLVSAGGADVFLACFDTNGNHVWSQSFGSPSEEWSWAGVELDGNGNLFFGCDINGSVDFGGGALPHVGGNDIALAKFDGAGNHQWSQSFGSTGYDWLPELALDADGNVTIVPTGTGSIDFGGGALPANLWTSFVVQFDNDGNYRWGRSLAPTSAGPSDLVETYGVDVGPGGDIFISGRLQGTTTLGSDTVTSSGIDILIARYGPEGEPRWVRSYGGDPSQDEWGIEIAFDGSGALTATGRFFGNADFGGGPIASNGSADAFVLVLDENTGEPVITSIADIGNDQGGEVKIRVDRSGFDRPGSGTTILSYEFYRRDDAAPSATVGDVALSAPDRETLTPAELAVVGWTYVGAVPAHGDANYGIDVPTIGDSTIVGGDYYSHFFVRAATGDPYTFYQSEPDSGYSVDNLAPAVPLSLVFDTGLLTWDESAAPDFDYFTVYGSDTDDFGAAVVVGYAVAPTLDVTGSPYPHYYVTATDFSGNESGPAGLSSTVGVGDTPRAYVLSVANFPNPFHGSTRVSYTLASRGHVTVAVYDTRGARVTTLVDEELDAGAYGATWDGRSSTGEAVSSGVYFARIVHDGQVRTKKMLLSR